MVVLKDTRKNVDSIHDFLVEVVKEQKKISELTVKIEKFDEKSRLYKTSDTSNCTNV